MENCTNKNKIARLIRALYKIGVQSEKKDDFVVVYVGKKNKDTGSFYQPLSTAKMKSGWIISTEGRVNLFLRKFLAKRGNNNEIIVKPV